MVKNITFEIEAYHSLFQSRLRQITSNAVKPKAINEIDRRAMIFSFETFLQDHLDFQVFSSENISERARVS